MTHVEQGELQAYLDGEVGMRSRAQIESHIHTCQACAAELEELRDAARVFAFAMRRSDAEAPTVSALAAVSAARGDVVRRRFSLSRASLSKAAIFLIGFAALASAAIPGTPLHRWIASALSSTAPAPAPAPPATVEPAAEPAPAPVAAPSEAPAALSIMPNEGRVVVILTDVAADAVIRVRLVDSDRAVVQATRGAAHARFRTGPGRIEVVGVHSGEVSVDLPRGASDARVETDGRVLFQRDHEQIRLGAAAATGTNSEYVFKGTH